MKLNVAVVGYGNLGKSLEKQVLSDENLHLVGVFSRRNISSPYKKNFADLPKFANEVDVALLALGSYDDLSNNIAAFAHFHTVDSFDTHDEMKNYKQLLNLTKPNKISVCGVGWDPGVQSLLRAAFIGADNITTFWGKGISQGHSNALRSIKGVLDAVEITVPNEKALLQSLQGKFVAEKERHTRLCYVCCVESDKQQVEREIYSMPNYFAGQNVVIEFCTTAEIRKLKQQTQHAGQIVAKGSQFFAHTNLQVNCNTDYTAQIMLAYAKAVPQLQKQGYCGALDPLDIPLKFVADSHLV